ncbi:S9 family peptidase [Allostreptomyces psammosilenae]|uniref:Dipeptidyl-peptidase-4 n=1 Tax=Allostreptomyces psammosilenae TaxID=1892865 RepID=A0A853A0H2_9ACTN|nr:prolyl oligopeptidase family serine peptidase [Allostreptomyces psammosilenae]NYI08076.1 dipeptidyl-peptidase-4 [Allostreptomyces psammosilenae]
MTTEISFPRLHARTQRFTLGRPRAFAVAPDGSRVAFLRSGGGTDPANRLYVLAVHGLDGVGAPSTAETLVADPAALLAGADEDLSPQERARRERAREAAAGIVSYTTDAAVTRAAFALSSRLFVAELTVTGGSAVRELRVPGPVIDPRMSPDGRHVAYVAGGALHVVPSTGGGSGDVTLAEPGGPGETWGLAEFIAAEEMGRTRGMWWSPDGDALLAAHVDDSPVRRWWIADPANPDREPAEVGYPRAGTPNADVRLALFGLDGTRTDVVWDREAYPYLAVVHWSAGGPPLLLVQSRDQRTALVLSVDTTDGSCLPVHAESDEVWLEVFEGVPAWTPDGRLVRITDEGGARRLAVGDRVLTGPELHVRGVLAVSERDVLVTASAGAPHPAERGAQGVAAAEREIGEVHVYRVGELGPHRITTGPGVHSAVRGGPVTVLVSATPGGVRHLVLREAGGDAGPVPAEAPVADGLVPVAEIRSLAEPAPFRPRVALVAAGERRVPAAVLLPRSFDPDRDGPLPVLMDPYGGPHGQRVVAASGPHLVSQWFADQGFAVVVADGRGTPGHSPAWEKSVHHHLAEHTLADQVEALRALADSHPLDLSRVGIRGWSYGGYLAALAVLRRPDVFAAGIAGAPVTDWRLYDTHYTERYLGHPDEHPEVYDANSIVADAAKLERPLMIIHGMADDNVVVAHSLRLSGALLAAGRPHTVLPLTGVTHMTPQEQVAENLLLLQVDFLKKALA